MGDPSSDLEAERVDFRITYEEQCANNRQHYYFKTRARNTPLEDLITSQPIEDSCPQCDGPIVGLPYRTAID